MPCHLHATSGTLPAHLPRIHPSGHAHHPEKIGFAVFGDVHLNPQSPEKQRYLHRVIELLTASPVTFAVFLGDLVQDQCRLSRLWADFEADMESLRASGPMVYLLRGNTDLHVSPRRRRFSFACGQTAFIGFDTAAGGFDAEECNWLAGAIREHACRHAVLFTHYYADALDGAGKDRLCECLALLDRPHLVAGHGHRQQLRQDAHGVHHLIAPVDPYKPGSARPGFDLFTLDPRDHACTRRRQGISLLSMAHVDQVLAQLGAAPSEFGNPAGLEHTLRSRGLRHLQLKWRAPVVKALGGPEVVRRWLDEGLLLSASLHASTPIIDDEGRVLNQAILDAEAAAAEHMHASTVTVHLPRRDQRPMCDVDGSVRNESALSALVEAYARALQGFYERGMNINLENTHWYDPRLVPEAHGEHQFGIRVAHLLAVRQRLAERWGDHRVAFCFDVGHALTNGPLAIDQTVADWFEQFSQRVGAIHFHDVIDLAEGGRQAHQPFGTPGGLVNLESFIHLYDRHARAAPLYLEMDALNMIEQSVEHLRHWRDEQRSLS